MTRRIILFGTSPFGLPSFTTLADADDLEIVGVVTQPGRPTGRHRTVEPSAVQRWAVARHYPVLTPETLKNGSTVEHIRQLRPDAIVVAAYGLIVPPTILQLPTFGCMNIHASLLPKYRGASPIAAAIDAGDDRTGITFMLMDAGLDTGPILAQFSVEIPPRVIRPELESTLADTAGQHVLDVLRSWCARRLMPRPQATAGVSHAPRLTREDGRAQWADAAALERRIRAYAPWPGVWTRWKQQELKILSAHFLSDMAGDETPGTVLSTPGGWGVRCRRGLLIPETIQFAGKRPVPSDSVPGSYPGFVGSVLG